MTGSLDAVPSLDCRKGSRIGGGTWAGSAATYYHGGADVRAARPVKREKLAMEAVRETKEGVHGKRKSEIV